MEHRKVGLVSVISEYNIRVKYVVFNKEKNPFESETQKHCRRRFNDLDGYFKNKY